jgi:hypothetical protein
MSATDCAKVLAYCETHGSITAREAFIALNINSPRKVIRDLRRKGYVIEVQKMDNNGRKPYHRYFVVGKEVE